MIIKSAEYKLTAVYTDQYPEDNLSEFCLLGRSNVGKSSFINNVLNRKKLAYTSQKPGKTQTLNFFLINEKFYFVDVPGYGYAKRSKSQIQAFGKMIETYLTTRENLKRVIMIVDMRHKPSKDDLLMYNFLKHYNLPVTIIATKSDKIGNNLLQRHMKIIKQELALSNEDFIFPYSSFTSKGRDEVLNHLGEILEA